MKKQILFMILISALGLNGCTFVFQGGRRSDLQKIENLSKQVDELSQVKDILEKRLSQEIKDKNVRLKMMEKGLVITFVADILFDSGKDKIRLEAMPILDKVARVLQENIPEFKVGIEGHSDNEPIKVSSWKSNWELSTARALSVLHYLIDQKSLLPERLSAIGYGEYHPVSANDSKEGRRLNRRVEIVILPKTTKVKEIKDSEGLKEPKENIK
ncbi:MAG: OmpA family protein [Candidatus Omnitrophota bacterium]